MELTDLEILSFNEKISSEVDKPHGLNPIILTNVFYSVLIQTSITILVVCKKVNNKFNPLTDQLDPLKISEIKSRIPNEVSASFIHYCFFDESNKCILKKEQEITLV